MPEVRRLIDWQVGFNSLSIITSIPVLALLPLVVIVLRAASKSDPTWLKLCAILWTTTFGYGLIVGWLSGRLIGAIYEFLLFTSPLLIGLWLSSMRSSVARETFERFVNATIWLSVVVSIYGIYQYVSPAPWDVFWMVNSGLASIGNPVPFEVRVFSTLNAPLACADFLAVAILLILYRLRRKTLWLLGPLALCVAAMALTLVRTAWLEVLLGVVVLICCSPRRSIVFGTTIAIGIAVMLVAANLQVLTGNAQVSNAISDRFQSLQDISDDSSADSRVHGSENTLHLSIEEPIGQGLGFAAGAKLAGSSTATAASTQGADNGYLERFLELGFFGFPLYCAAIIVALVAGLATLRRTAANGDVESASALSLVLAVQVALIGGDLSADHHLSLMGVFFWLSVGLCASLAPQAMRPGVQISRTGNAFGPARAG